MKNLWNNFTDYFGTTILHPQFIILRMERKAIIEAKKYAKGKLVDIGCGRMPYRKELEPLVESYIGVDHPKTSKLYHPKKQPEVLADATKLPFQDNTFDIALMLQVLEYLKNPQSAINEAARVLKSGGILIITSPFLYSIVDPPHDMARYTQSSLQEFIGNASLKIIKIWEQGSFLEFWFLSLNVFLLKRIKDIIALGLRPQVIFALPLILTAPFVVLITNILIVILRPVFRIFPQYPNYFPLNYLIVAKKS